MTGENKVEKPYGGDKVAGMLAARVLLKEYVVKNARKGDIQNIIETIDRFGWNEHWLMNLGDIKGKIVDQALQTRKPKTVLELGTFLGYSSLRFILQLPDDTLFITIEADQESADIARSIHEYAGVDKRIQIINDFTENVIPRLREDFHVDSFDFLFIDHSKFVYLRDLKLLEENNLIQSGTMIVADNVIDPGAPDYLEYIQNNPNYDSQLHETTLEYRNDIRDGVEISIRK